MTGAREVQCWPVFQFLAAFLGDPPTVILGTPAWHNLDDTDPAKWRAVLWAAMWWAVAEDAHQAAMAEAAKAVAASADWTRVGRPRGRAYIPRRVA